MIGNPEFITQIMTAMPRLEMQSRLSVAGAMAAFADEDFMKFSREKMHESKQVIIDILDTQGINYIPSDINFVLFEINEPGEQFKQKMLDQSVSLKNIAFDNKEWIRVSCGSLNELDAFAGAMKKLT